MVVERRAKCVPMRLEHRGYPLGVIADPLFERLPVRILSDAEVLHWRHDLVLELFDADAEGLGDVLDFAGQCPVDFIGERRQGLRSASPARFCIISRSPLTWRPCPG